MTNDVEKETHSCFFGLLDRDDFIEGVHWRRHRYASGEAILREGGYSGKVFLILQGSVRVAGSVAMSEGYTVRPGVKDLERGEIFGELALLDHAPHSATVTAIEDCELAALDNESLLAYLDRDRDIGYLIFRGLASALAARLRKADEKIFSLLAWGLKVHGYEKYMKSES
jgi:CRP-like cAMP-binding protein